MNSQREVVYTKRRNALSGERVEIDVMNMMQDIAQIIVEKSEGMPYADDHLALMENHVALDVGA